MRRVVFVTVVLMAVVGAAAGCARPGTPTSRPAPSQSGPPPSDRAAIYIAMLLRFIDNGAESAGVGATPPAVYVLATAKASAGVPTSNRQPADDPISAADQAAITAAVGRAYTGRFAFVASESNVLTSRDGCAVVRDGGVLVTLAPVQGAPGEGTDRLEVGITGFMACLGANGLDYVVQRQAGVWTVTGTTNSQWVA